MDRPNNVVGKFGVDFVLDHHSSPDHRSTAPDRDELLAAVDHFRKLALPLAEVDRTSFPLPRLRGVLADIRRELMEGRGIVMRVPLEGGGRLVVELTPDEAAALGDELKVVTS